MRLTGRRTLMQRPGGHRRRGRRPARRARRGRAPPPVPTDGPRARQRRVLPAVRRGPADRLATSASSASTAASRSTPTRAWPSRSSGRAQLRPPGVLRQHRQPRSASCPSYWPLGQRAPQALHPQRSPTPQACAFDYGWNAAKDSFAPGPGRRRVGRRPGRHPQRPGGWTSRCTTPGSRWSTASAAKFLRNDTAVLHGMTRAAAASAASGPSASTAPRTSGSGSPAGPAWTGRRSGTPGSARRARPASTATRSWSFTGGPVRLSQFLRNGFDADLRC